MKKLLLLLVMAVSISVASFAQEKPTKVKPTSTATEKVHNTFSKHKHHNGYKVKSEHHGIKHKKKVNTEKGEVKNKNGK